MFYFYIAHCADDTLYCGYTTDILVRETRHNQGTGARYTKNRRPITIVYWEEFVTKSAAMKREYEVKKWSRAAKQQLVASKKTVTQKKKQ